MSSWDGLTAGQVAYLIAVAVVAVTVGVGLLVAIAAAEARSRRGEAERVAAIRHRLAEERARQAVGVRS